MKPQRLPSLAMHRPIATAIALLVSLMLMAPSQPDGRPGDRHALVILVEGISADILAEVDTPHIDAIVATGAFSLGYVGGEQGHSTESPTISAVGYNHMLTGVWSNKHNVWTNDIHAPNYRHWNIFRLAAEQRPDLSTALYSSWTENRTHLLGEGREEAGTFLLDISYDGFERDTLSFPHDEQGLFIGDVDQHVAERAAESITENGPNLSWVYLWYPDATGHREGENAVHRASVRAADEQVGLIMEAVRERERRFDEDWLVIVTTDHGRRLPVGRDHGGQSYREREIWYAVNTHHVNSYFRRTHPPITSIFPTIARHLSLDIPTALNNELEGTALIGEVSISTPAATINRVRRQITVQWVPWEEEGQVDVYLAATNAFARGEADTYHHLATVPVREGEAVIDVGEFPSAFYKVAIEARHNTIGTWVEY